jgi:hypothetical protein
MVESAHVAQLSTARLDEAHADLLGLADADIEEMASNGGHP